MDVYARDDDIYIGLGVLGIASVWVPVRCALWRPSRIPSSGGTDFVGGSMGLLVCVPACTPTVN